MNNNMLSKIKISKKYLIEDDPYCKMSFALPVKQYIAISLKGMELSKVGNIRKTQSRFISKWIRIRGAKFSFKGGIDKPKKKEDELISYYKGETKNGKAEGSGVEVLISPINKIYPDHTVVQYYEGEWKNGKRNGYGECYDYHPLIGYAQSQFVEGQTDKIFICQDDEGSFYSGNSYKGNWKDGKPSK